MKLIDHGVMSRVESIIKATIKQISCHSLEGFTWNKTEVVHVWHFESRLKSRMPFLSWKSIVSHCFIYCFKLKPSFVTLMKLLFFFSFYICEKKTLRISVVEFSIWKAKMAACISRKKNQGFFSRFILISFIWIYIVLQGSISEWRAYFAIKDCF